MNVTNAYPISCGTMKLCNVLNAQKDAMNVMKMAASLVTMTSCSSTNSAFLKLKTALFLGETNQLALSKFTMKMETLSITPAQNVQVFTSLTTLADALKNATLKNALSAALNSDASPVKMASFPAVTDVSQVLQSPDARHLMPQTTSFARSVSLASPSTGTRQDVLIVSTLSQDAQNASQQGLENRRVSCSARDAQLTLHLTRTQDFVAGMNVMTGILRLMRYLLLGYAMNVQIIMDLIVMTLICEAVLAVIRLMTIA